MIYASYIETRHCSRRRRDGLDLQDDLNQDQEQCDEHTHSVVASFGVDEERGEGGQDEGQHGDVVADDVREHLATKDHCFRTHAVMIFAFLEKKNTVKSRFYWSSA